MKRSAMSTIIWYVLVRRTAEGTDTSPISRINPPASAAAERTTRSGNEMT